MAAEKRLVKEQRVRRMAKEEAIRQYRQETEFEAEYRRFRLQIDAIHNIA